MGVDKDTAAIETRIKRLELEYFNLQKAAKKAETDLALAEIQHERASSSYFQAEDKFENLTAKFSKFSKAGSPLMTGITGISFGIDSGKTFQASIWVPENDLDLLDKTIKALRNHLRRLDFIRKGYRSDFNRAMIEANAAGDDLNDAIYQSYLSQWLIESGFFVYDLKKAGKGGPYAVGAEIIKKAVETAIFPPSYYDATLSAGDAVLATLSKVPSGSVKRGLKTITTGQSKKILIEQLLRERGKVKLDDLWSTYMRRQWIDDVLRNDNPELFSKMTVALEKMITKQTAELEATEKAFAVMIGKQGFKKLAKQLGKSFLKGLAKDLTKEATKKAVAEFFEGSAFKIYIRNQAYLSVASRKLLRASSMYWTIKNVLEIQLSLRDELLVRYNPNAQIKVQRNDKFTPIPNYEIRLADNYGDPFDLVNRDILVKLGGIELKRNRKTLAFLLPKGSENKLAKDNKGGVKLEIAVLR